jgi:outer membrane protein assembly factor BamB
MHIRKYPSIIQVALIAAFLLFYTSYTTQASEPNWPQFRGPGGIGIAPDNRTYPTELDMSHNLLWKTEVSKGYSSPCIWGNNIFITACSNKVLETVCLDRGDGRIKWRRIVEPKVMQKITSMNSYASATPACDGKRLYVHFGSFGLLAYNLEGKELWKKPLPIPQSQHGSGTSPILADHMVVIHCDQDTDTYLLAADCETGETVWQHSWPKKRTPGYTTPVLWKHGQEQELIVLSSKQITSFDPTDGRQRWCLRDLAPRTAPSPVYAGETLFAMATATTTGDPVNPIELPDYKELLDRYDLNRDKRLTKAEIPDDFALVYRTGPMYTSLKENFSALDTDHDGALSEAEWTPVVANVASIKPKGLDTFVAVRSGAEGDANESYIKWRTSEGVGQVATPLVYRQRVYLVKEGGIVTCFNAETGDRVYSGKLGLRTYFNASPVAADGKIYICSYLGTVFVVQAGDEFKILARNKIGERINATPALVDGNIYLRTAKYMMAFGSS